MNSWLSVALLAALLVLAAANVYREQRTATREGRAARTRVLLLSMAVGFLAVSTIATGVLIASPS